MNEKLEFLKKVPLFQGAAQETVEKLFDKIHLKNYTEGEDVIREGESGSSLFVLFKGEVSVTKKMTLIADNSGKDRVEKSLIRLKDSMYAFFGEMVLCGNAEVRSATVCAETDCTLGELNAEDILNLIKSDAEFGSLFYQNLANVLASRLRKANKDILKLTTVLTLALEE